MKRQEKSSEVLKSDEREEEKGKESGRDREQGPGRREKGMSKEAKDTLESKEIGRRT